MESQAAHSALNRSLCAVFPEKGHDKKADQKIRLKKLCKPAKLCYSIYEANWWISNLPAKHISAWANW